MSHENYLYQLRREFNAVGGKYQIKAQRSLELVESTREEKLQAKFALLERTKTWHSDMRRLREISKQHERKKEIPSAPWFQELKYNLNQVCKENEMCKKIVSRLDDESVNELPPESITAPAFFKVLFKLKPTEFKNPDIASAIEFTRKHIIINLKRDDSHGFTANHKYATVTTSGKHGRYLSAIVIY